MKLQMDELKDALKKNIERMKAVSDPQVPVYDDKDVGIVEIQDNNIYFYADVQSDKVLKLNKLLKETDNKHQMECITRRRGELDPIYLFINSMGGYIFDGFCAMDNITSCQSPVITIADGFCASAATLIFLGGDKRLMRRNSFFLIHQLSSFAYGKYEELKDDILKNEKLMKKMLEIYTKKTKIPKSVLNDLMKHDIYFDVQDCLKYGIIEGVYE